MFAVAGRRHFMLTVMADFRGGERRLILDRAAMAAERRSPSPPPSRDDSRPPATPGLIWLAKQRLPPARWLSSLLSSEGCSMIGSLTRLAVVNESLIFR